MCVLLLRPGVATGFRITQWTRFLYKCGVRFVPARVGRIRYALWVKKKVGTLSEMPVSYFPGKVEAVVNKASPSRGACSFSHSFLASIRGTQYTAIV